MPSHLPLLPKPPPRQFTTGTLPPIIDPSQIPIKPQPFAALRAQKYVSSLDILLPAELGDIVRDLVEQKTSRYAKVILKLGDLLEGELFDQGIKKGDIIVLSEGRKGVDNRWELFDGKLHLELDNATYERAGLVGKPMRDGGMKHKTSRWAIELDLRHPSMLHGKKGFGRLIWACKNVLTWSLTCLFFDRTKNEESGASAALEKHHPRWLTSAALQQTLENIALPYFTRTFDTESLDGHDAAEMEEWLALAMLQSPRIQKNDAPDPIIARYDMPVQRNLRGEVISSEAPVASLTCIHWQGFLPFTFILEVLLAVKKGMTKEGWCCLRARGLRHANDTVTVLIPATEDLDAREFVCWHSPD